VWGRGPHSISNALSSLSGCVPLVPARGEVRGCPRPSLIERLEPLPLLSKTVYIFGLATVQRPIAALALAGPFQLPADPVRRKKKENHVKVKLDAPREAHHIFFQFLRDVHCQLPAPLGLNNAKKSDVAVTKPPLFCAIISGLHTIYIPEGTLAFEIIALRDSITHHGIGRVLSL